MKRDDFERAKELVDKIDSLELTITNFIIGGPVTIRELYDFADSHGITEIELSEIMVIQVKKKVIAQKEALEKELSDLGLVINR